MKGTLFAMVADLSQELNLDGLLNADFKSNVNTS